MRALALLALFPAVSPAQNSLREAFEGKTVTVQIDMPATKDGIDIYPERSTPMDFASYQQRIKRYGVGVHKGDSILITKVLVKEKLIEFHLGGGGYGTFGDESGSSVYSSTQGPSRRERDLSTQIRTATGDQKRSLERELDGLRRDRERENTRVRAEAAQAQELAKTRIEQKRKEGGSRFNIRYEPRVPEPALAPETIAAALAQYVEFSSGPAAAQTVSSSAVLPMLRKGMSRREVDALLGTPIDVTERNEGAIRVATAVYDVHGVTGKVDFADGVLLKFLYQSR
jgi:hypothetical protein